MSALQFSLSILPPSLSLSSSSFLSSPNDLFLTTKKLSHLSLRTTTTRLPPIRMGGGPRTFPGGVSKWQWKRMQDRKSKQLLKARLARERQIYEMRKRAEMKAAVAELERPWEAVEKAPKLFSVGADEQVKVLADRFQKPGGFDMWSESDGPRIFGPVDGVPSARFFPKGVVHSTKPYGKVDTDLDEVDGLWPENGRERNNRHLNLDTPVSDNYLNSVMDGNGKGSNGKLRQKGRRIRSGAENSGHFDDLGAGGVGGVGEQRRETPARRTANNGLGRWRDSQKPRGANSEVFRGGNSRNLDGFVSGGVGGDGEQRRETKARRTGNNGLGRGTGSQKPRGANSEVFRGGNSRNLDGFVSGGVGGDGQQRRETKARRTGNNGLGRGTGSPKSRGANLDAFRGGNSSNLNGFVSGGGGGGGGQQRRETPARRTGNNGLGRGRGSQKSRGPDSKVFDMSVQHDGSYGFQAEKRERDSNIRDRGYKKKDPVLGLFNRLTNIATQQ